jgi:UDP-N-acetylglucosamine--N-acetylmuramyl-(pentapeptide) pyrophosphoryl-undecaprenol N-acetylglucosamine transferase
VGRAAAIKFFGLDPAKPTVLVTGGSLGAKGINEAIAAHIDEFAVNETQLVWQTGKPFAATAADLCKGKPNIWTGDFITKMEYAFPAGDVVISRSGAMSIAELCVAGRAVIFVPFPFAAEDHQTVNAQHLVNKGAGILVKDSEAKEKLVATAIGLLKDEPGRRQLEENIGRLAVTNADEVIAGEILKRCSN